LPRLRSFAKKIKGKTWTLCGTPEYLSPEIVSGKGHGKGVRAAVLNSAVDLLWVVACALAVLLALAAADWRASRLVLALADIRGSPGPFMQFPGSHWFVDACAQVDWWTLGILIYEMLASYTPFYHEDHMKMYQKIAKVRPDPFAACCFPSLVDLIPD
jgi:serine/threonine protein kinase